MSPRPFARKRIPFLSTVFSRARDAGVFRLSRGTLVRLVKNLSGAGNEAGREPPSRGQAVLGLGLYALLVPFGIRALCAHYWVTGPLLLGIGLAGAAGILLRNFRPPATPSDRRPR